MSIEIWDRLIEASMGGVSPGGQLLLRGLRRYCRGQSPELLELLSDYSLTGVIERGEFWFTTPPDEPRFEQVVSELSHTSCVIKHQGQRRHHSSIISACSMIDDDVALYGIVVVPIAMAYHIACQALSCEE